MKEQLYESKLDQLRVEKQEQEDILNFMKTKVNSLEREILQYDIVQDHEDGNYFNQNLIQKLPDNYIDYSPTP